MRKKGLSREMYPRPLPATRAAVPCSEPRWPPNKNMQNDVKKVQNVQGKVSSLVFEAWETVPLPLCVCHYTSTLHSDISASTHVFSLNIKKKNLKKEVNPGWTGFGTVATKARLLGYGSKEAQKAPFYDRLPHSKQRDPQAQRYTVGCVRWPAQCPTYKVWFPFFSDTSFAAVPFTLVVL